MTGLMILLIYIAIFTGAFFVIKFFAGKARSDFTSLKTVTFGDESAVVSSRWASIISILTIFMIWGAFTGSKWVPDFLQAPAPFTGETSFVYTLEDAEGNRDDATVFVRVVDFGEEVQNFDVAPGEGIAKDDSLFSRSNFNIFI